MAFCKKWAADLVMLGLTALWALNFIVMKVALQGWLTPGGFTTVRFALGAALMCGVALGREGSLYLPRPLFIKVALLGILGNGFNQMFFIYGLALGQANNAGLWLATVPILVVLVAGAAGVERITWRIWAGAILSAMGIVIVLSAAGTALLFGIGDLFLFGAALSWALYTVYAQPLVKQASPIRITAVAMVMATAGLLVINVPALIPQDFGAVPPISWLGILYAGFISTAAGYTLYNWSVQRIGPARVALFNNLMPIVTAFWAWLFLGERWTPLQWLGVAVVIGGVVVARWDDVRRAALGDSARTASQSGSGST